MSTLGWTVTTWKKNQLAATNEEGLQRILHLIETQKKDDPAWITIASDDDIKSQWNVLQRTSQIMGGSKNIPLYGVPFAVKDNIDVKEFPTTAACPEFKYQPKEDSYVVKLLKSAGAIVIGKTNLDQFATGLVGTRSPYGQPSCAFSELHVSGGSSSGSASVTARGIVPFALGTDTAGSGRVPAHLNNLIGVKPSRGIVSTSGVVPACRTLDCVSIFTLCLSDAELLLEIVAQYDKNDPYSRQLPNPIRRKFENSTEKNLKFAVPASPLWFDDTKNAEVFDSALNTLKSCGIQIVPVDFTPLHDLGNLLYEGAWVAERYTVVKDLIRTIPEAIDETVRKIIKNAEKYTAADCFEYEYRRQELIRKIEEVFSKFDGLIAPTAPLNPTFEDVKKEPILVNSRQGTYTNFVNLNDMSAIAIPAGFRSDNLPFGITLYSKKFNDFALLEIAERFLRKFPKRKLGLNFNSLPECDQLKGPEKTIPLAVVGAHLSGMPLNYQLTQINAKLWKKTKTSARYELYALEGTAPRKPGLVRVKNGAKIEIEVWDVPKEQFGTFIENVSAPLGIGTVELEDSTSVHGFICEPIGIENATNITKFGGWRSYIQSL
ncbi:urea amidolyase-like [Chrysoperla carnea]|uniref:urea amidolyase-like n=1 Tax=Chrysoperla carnea TaxID=189513 RepID=UPI001D061DE8|nr:urea amidolyase-like [Chrysoperla carnea]